MVDELLESSSEIRTIFAVPEWFESTSHKLKLKSIESIEVTERELKQISGLTTPNLVLAIAAIPNHQINLSELPPALYLALDDIRDPGNMGTIIRTADWFGIETIFCSTDCVDVYNPKVVQATMGSISRVKVFETDLFQLIQSNKHLPVYGAVLKGENIHRLSPLDPGIIVVGNESKGIHKSLVDSINRPISIPAFGKAESLNAAIAVGIILNEFRRK